MIESTAPGQRPTKEGLSLGRVILKNFWIVLIAIAVGGFAGWIMSRQVNIWRAESSLIVQNPAANQIFVVGGTNSARYVASQLAILESSALASRVLGKVGTDSGLTVQDVIDSREIVGLGDTDLITIYFRDDDPEIALRFANGYLDVYKSDRKAAAADSFETAVSELDSSIAEVDSELAQIENAIVETSAANEINPRLEERAQQSVEQYLARPNPTIEALDEVVRQLEALRVAREIESSGPQIGLLLEQRRETAARRTQLVIRRDQVQVDSALALSGVEISSRALSAIPDTGKVQIIALASVLGALLGVAIAYTRSSRNEIYSNRYEPETILGAPLLGEIPKFSTRTNDDLLPILTNSSSPAAEGFRFVSAALDARLALAGRSSLGGTVIAVASAYLGDGKTVVASNLALAAASEGESVLVVDGDFGDPTLTRLFLGETASSATEIGMTNVVRGEIVLDDIVIPIDLSQGLKIDLITRGNAGISAPDFFKSKGVDELFANLRNKYDRVIIDGPPLLQISYAIPLARLADALVAVVPHGGRMAASQELIDRLDVVGAPLIGYVYNLAPRRAEMTKKVGSTRYPLGAPVK